MVKNRKARIRENAGFFWLHATEIVSDKTVINCDVPRGVYVIRLGNVCKKVVL